MNAGIKKAALVGGRLSNQGYAGADDYTVESTASSASMEVFSAGVRRSVSIGVHKIALGRQSCKSPPCRILLTYHVRQEPPMKTKLTLRLDERLIERAKRYSNQSGRLRR